MKGIPLPSDVGWGLTLLFWGLMIALGFLFALCAWFIKRYIDKNDAHHSKVEGTLKEHSQQFKGLTDKMSEQATRLNDTATQMAKTQANFQTDVSKELLKVYEVTNGIKNDLNQGKLDVGFIKKTVEDLVQTVQGHAKSLSLGAQAMAKQRDEMLTIKTTVTKLNDELTLIGQKMVKKEDKK